MTKQPYEYYDDFCKSLGPECARREQRICFGLAWFDTQAAAKKYAAKVRDAGRTYNGGYFHGSPCGRNPGFDYFDANLGKRLYAVTD